MIPHRIRFAALVLILSCLRALDAAGHAPHDVVRVVAVPPSFADDGTVISFVQLSGDNYVAISSDRGRSWTHLGTTMSLMDVRRFAYSPAYAQDRTAFTATANNGVWKSVDGGLSWDWSATGLPSVTRDVAVSPQYWLDRVVLAATATGVGRSTDGGATWTAVGPPGTSLTVTAFAEESVGTAFAGGDSLYRSVDGGQTWSSLFGFPSPPVRLVVSPHYETDGTLAVCFGRTEKNPLGVSVSTDGGLNFVEMSEGLTDLFVNDLAIADDGTFFAVAESAACFRADGALEPWTLFEEGFEDPAVQTDSHFKAIAVSPSFSTDGAVFVGAHEGLFSSDDRGESWKQSEIYHQLINRLLQISPTFEQDGRIYAGNYGGGPYMWDENIKRWSALGKGVQALYSGALAISPTFAIDQTLLYGNTGLWKTTDGGLNWVQIAPTAGGVIRGLAISPQFAVDGVAFMNRPDSGGTFRTTDGGNQWTLVPGLESGRAAIAMSPAFDIDATVFASVGGEDAGILRSTDGGDTWENVSGLMAGAFVSAIAASPSFALDDVVLAGTRRHGLYRSDDGGDSWTRLESLPSGGGDKIESVWLSPDFQNDETVFVISFYDGVLRSTDGGTNWQLMNVGLPPDVKRKIVVSPNFVNDRTLYVTTHAC